LSQFGPFDLYFFQSSLKPREAGLLKIIVNALGFQLIWFACAFTANSAWPVNSLWIGALTLIFLCQHIYFTLKKKSEFVLILKVAIIGWMMDTLLIQSQLISFESSYPNKLAGIQPFWMTCLWLSLGATLNLSLAWLKKLSFLSPLIGALIGTFSYYAGDRLSVLHFQSTLSILLTSLFWGLVLPILILLATDESSRSTSQP